MRNVTSSVRASSSSRWGRAPRTREDHRPPQVDGLSSGADQRHLQLGRHTVGACRWRNARTLLRLPTSASSTTWRNGSWIGRRRPWCRSVGAQPEAMPGPVELGQERDAEEVADRAADAADRRDEAGLVEPRSQARLGRGVVQAPVGIGPGRGAHVLANLVDECAADRLCPRDVRIGDDHIPPDELGAPEPPGDRGRTGLQRRAVARGVIVQGQEPADELEFARGGCRVLPAPVHGLRNPVVHVVHRSF